MFFHFILQLMLEPYVTLDEYLKRNQCFNCEFFLQSGIDIPSVHLKKPDGSLHANRSEGVVNASAVLWRAYV
jgi:hypothetical protein